MDSDFLSKPKAFNFAITKPWSMQSKALEKSVWTAAKTSAAAAEIMYWSLNSVQVTTYH